MTEREIVEWLLEGDVAIEYQARRDLLGEQCPDLQRRIGEEGWRVRVLSFRKSDGTWGRGFSQPKWTSSHYTLLGLRTLELPANNPMAREKNETAREATGAGEPLPYDYRRGELAAAEARGAESLEHTDRPAGASTLGL